MKTVLMIGNSASSFLFFRKDLIVFFKSKGIKTIVLVPKNLKGDEKFLDELRQLTHVELFFLDSKGANPIIDLISIFSIFRLAYKIKPDITFLYTSKVIAFGGIALSLMGSSYISFFTGLGYLFTHKNLKAKIGRLLIYLGAVRSQKIVVLNNDDEKIMCKFFNDKNKILKIPGEGVSVGDGIFEKKVNPKIRGLYLGRFISDKGLYELFDALEILKSKIDIDFTFAGPLDTNSPSSLEPNFVLEKIKTLNCSYDGFVSQPIEYMKDYDFIILPSYREGLPKSLLEACAAKLPILATNVEGCREVCIDSVNGYLFEPRSVDSIVDVINRFIKLPPNEREIMGQKGFDLVKNEFSSDKVNMLTLDLINNLERFE